MTILKKKPLRTVALGALLVGAISCGGSSTSTPGGNSAGSGGTSGGTSTGTTTTTCSTGSSFSHTTGTDNLVGTACNDTFQLDNSSTVFPTGNASDKANGGDGTDTFEIFGVTTVAGATIPAAANVTNMEVIRFAGQMTNNHADVSSLYTKAVSGTVKYAFDDIQLLSAKTITTSTGQSLQIGTGSGGAVTAGTVTWAAAAADTALDLIFNGYQWVAGGTPSAVTVTGAAATTLNITSQGAENKTGTFTGPTTVTKHVISGAHKFTYALAAADAAALDSINASAATNDINVDVSAGTTKSAFAFTGGSGNDTVLFANNNTGSLTSGSQIACGAGSLDKIGIKDTALSSTENTAINAATGCEVLGLNAAITADASLFTSIKRFSIDTTALTQSITTMATGSTVYLNATAPTSLTLTGNTGVTDASLVFDVTSSDTTNVTAGTLVVTGLTSVAIASNGKGSETNAVTTLTNSDNTTFTLTGSQQFTAALSAGTAAGSVVNGSAMTGKLIITGSNFNDTLTGGSAADTLWGCSAATTVCTNERDVLTGGAGADTFKFVEPYATSAAASLTALLVHSAGTGGLVKIKDFVAGSDKIYLNTSGTAFTSPSMTLANAQTITTAADLTAVYAGITAISASATTGALSGVVVTVSGGAAAGVYLYINDATAGVSNSADMLIDITGLSGTLTASDFIFS